MRLLDTRTLELQEFYLSAIPRYAILSHTWGDGEVTFQDISLASGSRKKGWAKITQTCRLAVQHGLEYAWVDTCCVDKSSSAELSESVNSMFQWYMNAAICYVALEDLPPDIAAEDGLVRCRWFTRGWTLQELLAPNDLRFYDLAWNYRGNKHDFIRIISTSTGIPAPVILGRTPPADCSVAEKMSWAARRETTRVEDTAYCLLGIFDVNMPLIYGEGMRAFRRLQEEIVKRRNDLTIFSWNSVQGEEEQELLGLFAPSPAAFATSSGVVPFTDDFAHFAVTNRGLRVSGDVPLRTFATLKQDGNRHPIFRYGIFLGMTNHLSADRGIYLRKIGPNLFYRDGIIPLAGFGRCDVDEPDGLDVPEYDILIDPVIADTRALSTFRDSAVHVPFGDVLELDNAVPENLWDVTDRVFLRPKSYSWTRYPMVIAMEFSGTLAGNKVRLVVLCDYRKPPPKLQIFEWDTYRHQAAMIFKRKTLKNDSMLWTDLESQAPELLALKDSVELIRARDEVCHISVSFKKGIVEEVSMDVELFSLRFDFDQRSSDAMPRGQKVSSRTKELNSLKGTTNLLILRVRKALSKHTKQAEMAVKHSNQK